MRGKGVVSWVALALLGISLTSAQEPGYTFFGPKKVERLEVLEAAPVTIPAHIRTLAIVNRYLPREGGGLKIAKKIEAWNSGELYGQDRRGSEAGVQGLADTLRQSDRFDVVRPAIQLEGSGMAFLPDPLDRDRVQEICTGHDADALVTLEAFDSGAKWKYGEPPGTGPDAEPRGRVRVTTGWRMYDCETGFIVDEYHDRDSEYIDDDQEGAVERMARVSAAAYANRIAPHRVVVDRLYFHKGCPDLKRAAKLAKRGDWDGAEELWRKVLQHTDSEVCGRAAHNLALACERKGDLEHALEWARKAATEYDNRMARSYVAILEYRLAQRDQAETQLAGVTG
jgi:hypothetical protein